jgi:hypothetical protein
VAAQAPHNNNTAPTDFRPDTLDLPQVLSAHLQKEVLCPGDPLMKIARNAKRNRNTPPHWIIAAELARLLYKSALSTNPLRTRRCRQQLAFNILSMFLHLSLHPSFQCAFNSTGGGTVTRGRDTYGGEKKLACSSLPRYFT